jgi:hypothetical protein
MVCHLTSNLKRDQVLTWSKELAKKLFLLFFIISSFRGNKICQRFDGKI